MRLSAGECAPTLLTRNQLKFVAAGPRNFLLVRLKLQMAYFIIVADTQESYWWSSWATSRTAPVSALVVMAA